MKPGASARNTSGRPYASQHQMKRAALSAESTNSAPPLWRGLLATKTDGVAVEKREAHDYFRREERLELEEALLVDDSLDQPTHVEGDVLGLGHVVVGTRAVGSNCLVAGWRGAPVLRQVREVGSRLLDGFGIVDGEVVPGTGHRRMEARATQLVKGGPFTDHHLDHAG